MKTKLLAFIVLYALISTQPLLASPAAETASPAHKIATTAPTWQDEVREILDSSREARAELEQNFAAATSETEALEIQLRIQKLEENTELQVMTVQLVHLQKIGRVTEATALAAAIEAMKAPRPIATPQNRSERPDGQERR